MPTNPQRSKLKKYLGKTLTYTGKLIIKKETNLMIDIRYNNKLLTNHVWFNQNERLTNIESGSEVSFNATAYSYKDSQNNRKYGLCKIHNIRKIKIAETCDEITINVMQKKIRCNKG